MFLQLVSISHPIVQNCDVIISVLNGANQENKSLLVNNSTYFGLSLGHRITSKLSSKCVCLIHMYRKKHAKLQSAISYDTCIHKSTSYILRFLEVLPASVGAIN